VPASSVPAAAVLPYRWPPNPVLPSAFLGKTAVADDSPTIVLHGCDVSNGWCARAFPSFVGFAIMFQAREGNLGRFVHSWHVPGGLAGMLTGGVSADGEKTEDVSDVTGLL
jgi:hypothetical protein